MIDTAFEDGLVEGEAIGIQKGREAERAKAETQKQQVILKAIQAELGLELIAQMSSLTVDIVKIIQSQSPNF